MVEAAPTFVKYVPSALENSWHRAVHGVAPTSCAPWQNTKSGVLRRKVNLDLPLLAAQTPSHMVFASSDGSKESVAIEPLVNSLRHPLLLGKGGNDTRKRMMDKTHIRLPPADLLQRHRAAGGKVFFLDMGAGRWGDGCNGRGNHCTAGGQFGGSLQWMTHRFAQRGIHFDRIIAWEAQRYPKNKLSDDRSEMPPHVSRVLTYNNVPVEAEPLAKHNPWRTLAEFATKLDYVVVKLDIDDLSIERQLVEQLLGGNSPASGLIDELFWEHHVIGSVAACPTTWHYRHGQGWEFMFVRCCIVNRTYTCKLKRELRVNDTGTVEAFHSLTGSYDLFARLRQLGIAAHSWV